MMTTLSRRQGASSGGSQFSVVTRPVERLVATAQNGLEVLRLGGLETGSVPSPFQIVESVPMYKLRRYFPPDSRPGATPAGPAGADGAPDDDVGRHVGRHPRRRRGRDPARRRAGSLGHRLRLTRQGRGRHAPQPGRPHRRAQPGHRHRQGGHRPRRPPGRVLAGRHVLLPGRGLPAVQEPRQHRRVRLAGGHPGRAADGYPGELRRAPPPTSWPTTSSAGWTSQAGWRAPVFRCSTRSRPPRRGSTSCASCTTARRCCRANSSAGSSSREGWIAWSGPAISELLKQFIAHNRMMTGGFAINGQMVTLTDITCPVLAFVGEVDDIGQPASVRGIRRAAPQRRGLRIPHPHRTFRPGRRIQGGATDAGRRWPNG